MRRLVIAAVSLASVPLLTWAQGRGGGAGFHAVAAPHMAAPTHAAAPLAGYSLAAPRLIPGGHYVYTRSGAVVYRPPLHSTSLHSGTRRLASQDIPVPGLGFDYPHLAAIGGGRGRFPGHLHNHVYFPFLAYFPFFGGGYYPLFPGDYDEAASGQEQAEAAPPPDYYQQAYPPAPRPADAGQNYRPPVDASAASAPAAPERPSDEYVFVRRDGTLFFAVAYAWENGNLRYVTSEGVRRSVAGTALDLDATEQFNEQRGLTFRPPVA